MTTFILLVAVSVIANMALGSVWYMPKVFGKSWMKDVGINPKSVKTDAMMRAMMTSAVCYAVLAVILGYAANRFTLGGFQQFMVSVFFCWVAFVLSFRVMHALFEQRSVRYIAITAGHDLASLVITGAIMYYA